MFVTEITTTWVVDVTNELRDGLFIAEVCDRRSSGGFEVTSSASDETKTEPQRTNSGGFEVTSTAMETTVSTVLSEVKEPCVSAGETSQVQSADVKEAAFDSDESTSKEQTEADSSAEKLISDMASAESQTHSTLVMSEEPKSGLAESARTEGMDSAVEQVQSSDDVVMSCESSTGKQDVTSTTEREVEVKTNQKEDVEGDAPKESDNEAVSATSTTTPVQEDDNSNHSDEMYFDACSATPDKSAKSATNNGSEEIKDASERPTAETSDIEKTSVSQTENSSEPMEVEWLVVVFTDLSSNTNQWKLEL